MRKYKHYSLKMWNSPTEILLNNYSWVTVFDLLCSLSSLVKAGEWEFEWLYLFHLFLRLYTCILLKFVMEGRLKSLVFNLLGDGYGECWCLSVCLMLKMKKVLWCHGEAIVLISGCMWFVPTLVQYFQMLTFLETYTLSEELLEEKDKMLKQEVYWGVSDV